jgi:hypothetical protein
LHASKAAIAAACADDVDSVFTLATLDDPVVGGAGTVVAAPLLDGPDVVGSEVVGPEVDGVELAGPDPVVDGPEVDGPEVVAPDDDGADEAGPLVDGALVDGPLLVGATVVLEDDEDDVVPAVRADAKLFVRAIVASPPTAATTAKLLVFRDMVVLLGLLVHGTRPLKQRRPGAPDSISMTHGTEPSRNTGRHQRRCSGAPSTLVE